MKTLFRLSRPLHLLLTALTYLLGAGIADYLGRPFRADSFWLGLVAVLFAQASMNWLTEVFRPINEPIVEGETRKERLTVRNNALYASIAALSANAVIAYLLYRSAHFSVTAFFLALLSLILVLTYSVPPFRFVNRGFGEFILAAQLAYVVPSIGYILQADEMNRLLLTTVPLTFLALAYFIVMDFPAFASDIKYGRGTLLTRLGWERVVPLHHLLILLAYLFFLAVPVFNQLSLSDFLRVFISLPFAVLQVYLLRNLALGAPARWTLLTVTALGVFVLTAYLLAVTFWFR